MMMLNARLVLLTIGCLSFLSTTHAAAPKSAQTGATQAGSGVLEAAQREYTPQGCSHNGNTMECTFGVVNRGNPLTLRAWPGDLRTLQLVDASHVPHDPNRAYFVDAAGTHQTQLLLQQSDQGSIVVEFPNVDANSTASEFHLHSQIVGGVGGAQAATSTGQSSSTSTAGKNANTPSTSKSTAAPAAGTATAAHALGGTGGAASPAAGAVESASCASNAKSAACRATQQGDRVCAKNANSAACKNATARAKKLGATGN